MRLVGYGLILIIVVTTVAQVAVYAPKLPDQVASHFGDDGQADDTMSKSGFLTMYCLVQAGLMLMMLGIGKLCRILPVSMINLPHKEYWLHPDRKNETIRWIEGVTLWMAILTGFFMIGLFQSTFQANLAPQPVLDNTVFTILMVLYLGGLAAMVFFMIFKFARVPK